MKNVVVILLDSLNRHMIGAYGGKEFSTPNLDRFASSAVKFTRHYTGSLPCIPARHDILCGAWDFLWKPWGSIELWEDAITYELRSKDIVCQLISDHPHLFETGGENYHVDFSGWSYERGHVGDLWKTRPDPSWIGTPVNGRKHRQYNNSRTYFREEADFPGPRTMSAAAKWLNENATYHDRFFLLVDEFDPHEPFDTPEPWASRYDREWKGPHLIWPPYTSGAVQRGVLSQPEARQLRASYGAKLSMIDHWLGKVLDAITSNNLSDNTLVIVCSDHGHYLGEKDIWGKPPEPLYEPISHIPLMIQYPRVPPGVCDALTTSVDIHATVAEFFGVSQRQRTHGKSLLPLLRKQVPSVREYVLTGVWGRDVQIVTHRFKYSRGPVGGNRPLSLVSNRWSTRPIGIPRYEALPLPDQRAVLDSMPGSNVPVLHQRWETGDKVPTTVASYRSTGNHLFDLDEDPHERRDLVETELEEYHANLLRNALFEVNAPSSQFERLQLSIPD